MSEKSEHSLLTRLNPQEPQHLLVRQAVVHDHLHLLVPGRVRRHHAICLFVVTVAAEEAAVAALELGVDFRLPLGLGHAGGEVAKERERKCGGGLKNGAFLTPQTSYAWPASRVLARFAGRMSFVYGLYGEQEKMMSVALLSDA